jgi:hypothetical protein
MVNGLSTFRWLIMNVDGEDTIRHFAFYADWCICDAMVDEPFIAACSLAILQYWIMQLPRSLSS